MIVSNEPARMTDHLKAIIDKQGPDYLVNEPYEVYQALVENRAAERKTAGAFLYLTVSGALEKVSAERDPAALTGKIQRRCGFNKEMARCLAEIVSALYSEENRHEWKEKEREGLNRFLAEEEIDFEWNGYAVWDAGSGTVDCHYDAEICVAPTEAAANEPALAEMLRGNPFLKEEDIRAYFEKKIREFLNDEFEEYCQEDDYYQPVVEDFELEERVQEWCGKNGFELLGCDGDGDDDGFEPKYRRGWF